MLNLSTPRSACWIWQMFPSNTPKEGCFDLSPEEITHIYDWATATTRNTDINPLNNKTKLNIMNTISMIKPQGFQLDDIFNSAYSKSTSILHVYRTYNQISQKRYTFIEQIRDQLFAFIFHLSGNSQEKTTNKQTDRQKCFRWLRWCCYGSFYPIREEPQWWG